MSISEARSDKNNVSIFSFLSFSEKIIDETKLK